MTLEDLVKGNEKLEKELAQLRKDSNWLRCLEMAGVDNWDGWDYASELLKEDEDE